MKLGEIFVEMFFKSDTYKVKDFARTVGEIPFSLIEAGAALVGLDLGFMALTHSTLDTGNALLMFQAQTGEATDYLERWEMAGRRVNVQNETVAGSFQKMMAVISQLKTFGTGPAGELFGRLGIQGFMGKTPEQLMTELRSKYLSLKSPQDIQKFWQAAGGLIDPQMSRVFQGPDPNSMRPIIGEGGKQTAAELTAALNAFTDEVKGDFVPVLKILLPAIEKLSHGLIDVLRWLFNSDPNKDPILRWANQIKSRASAFSEGYTEYPHVNSMFIPGVFGLQGAPRLTVHQNFYGDVDKTDIDDGRLSLEHSLIRASRQLNKGGR